LLTNREDLFFVIPWSGFSGVSYAFMVAVKQLMPEQSLPLFGLTTGFRMKVSAPE
jgi:hypothetical protein